LDLGYGSGLSECSKGKQKQTVEQSQTNCQLKQIICRPRLHVKHDQMKLSDVFVYLQIRIHKQLCIQNEIYTRDLQLRPVGSATVTFIVRRK